MTESAPTRALDLEAFAASLELDRPAGSTTEYPQPGAAAKATRRPSFLARLFLAAVARSASLRRGGFRLFFNALARRSVSLVSWTQMNYGYATVDGDGHTIALEPADEAERFCHQLHARVAGAVDLANKDHAEVSCGRGGGAAFVHKSFGPKSTIGIDIAPCAIEFCRARHVAPGLEFSVGDAENLPLEDESVDAITNIEASFCYGDMGKFLAEVHRVLRPGGWFLFADMRLLEEVSGLLDELRDSGLEVLEGEDITQNVFRSLELDHDRRISMIHGSAPRLLRGAMGTFAGVKGSRMPNLLSNREMLYLRFVARKSAASQA